MKHLLPLAAFLATFLACGPVQGEGAPDTYTSQGFRVYLNTADPVWMMSVDRQIDIQGAVASEILGTEVSWYEVGDDILLTLTDECEGALRDCAYAGLTYIMPHRFPMTVLWSHEYGTACAGTSALAHELTHVALFLVDGDPDSEHLEDFAWSGPGSITQRSMNELMKEFPCGQ